MEGRGWVGELVVILNGLAQATGDDDVIWDEVYVAHLNRRLRLGLVICRDLGRGRVGIGDRRGYGGLPGGYLEGGGDGAFSPPS